MSDMMDRLGVPVHRNFRIIFEILIANLTHYGMLTDSEFIYNRWWGKMPLIKSKEIEEKKDE